MIVSFPDICLLDLMFYKLLLSPLDLLLILV